MPDVVVTFRAENEEAVIRAFDRVTRSAQIASTRTSRSTRTLSVGARSASQEVNFLNRTLSATNNLLRTAGQRIASRVFIVGAAIAFVRVLAEIAQGFQTIIAEGFRFNRQIEQSAIALTAIIGATRELAIANGETIAAIMFYPILLAESRRRQREILFLSIETLGTAEDLTGVYQRLLSFTATQNATDNERLTLASNLLNISRLIGLNAAETLIEIRQLTTLDNQRGQAVLQVLGLNIQQLRNWKEQGELVARLNDALEPIRAIGREIGESFQGVLESVRSLFGITTGDAFSDVFRGALNILQGIRNELREVAELGGLTQIIDISPQELEELGRRLGSAIIQVSTSLARLTADFIEFTAQNPAFINGLLRFFEVLELTLRGTAVAFTRIITLLGSFIEFFLPATQQLHDASINATTVAEAVGERRGTDAAGVAFPGVDEAISQELIKVLEDPNDRANQFFARAVASFAESTETLLDNLEQISLSDAANIFMNAAGEFSDSIHDDIRQQRELFSRQEQAFFDNARKAADLYDEAFTRQIATTEDALEQMFDLSVGVATNFITRDLALPTPGAPIREAGIFDLAKGIVTALRTDLPISQPQVNLDNVTTSFAEASRQFTDFVRVLRDTPSFVGGVAQDTSTFVSESISRFPAVLREVFLSVIETAVPTLISTAVGFGLGVPFGPAGAIGGASAGFLAGGALTVARLGERLDDVEARRVTETELREAGRPESILELAGGIDRRLTRLNEILETGFQDLTLPEVNERLEEFAEIRAQLAPLEEQARDLIRADPSLVAGGEETQAALDQSLGNILKIFELFVASLQTRVRSLDEANRATITLERQFAQAVAGQIQARFRVGIGVLDEFITAQKELIAATRASNVARVDSNVQGIQAAEDFSRVQTQGLFTSVPGLIGQQAEFNIKEESATIQEITAERQTQLEIQMQAGQSALSLITQERQFLDFQRTSLQEQTTLIEREGQLRQEQNTATRENLVLQAADRAERLEVLERELAQTTGALATTRRTFLATPEGVDVVALEEFDQGAEIALNTITSAISELRNELDTLNGSITNTQAAAEVLANQTARDVRELISNRPEIALQNQQEQDDIALATLRRATIERQLQLELRNREGQIVLDTINSDLAYLQSRGTDLNEQIALVELRGQLQTVLAERELESLRLQRFEAEQRRDIIQEQINLFETAAAQSRETLVTDPQTPPAQIIAFDARTTRDLSTLKDTFSGVVGDIDRTNAALSETSAAIRQVGVDTARTVEDISTVTINLGETIREALSQFAIGLARGTTDLDQLAGRLADSIEASFISGFTEALTAKLDFDQKIMKNLADLSGVFTNFADFIGGILSGIFGTAGVATEQFGRGAVEVFNAIFRSGAPAGGAVAATGPTAVVPAAPEAAPVSGAASAASAAVLNSAENAAEHSSEATQAANQAAQAAGTTVAVVAQAQSTILSGLANIGESLLGVARLVTQQVGTSLGAEAGGGSNAARVGAQIGDAAGSAIGTAAGAAVSTAFNLAGTFLGNVLGPLGGILGGLAGSFIGGLLGGLFAPGRIALEKRAIRRDLRQGLSFDPEFGSGYVGTTDPDRRALEAIGTFRALDEIRKNDERGQGTVQRYVNQAIHAFQNANLTVEQRQQEIFRLAEQNGLDNPVNVLQTFRVFDREHGLDEIIESREEGLEEGNLITRADILSGAIDIYAQFDERINSVAIANSFLADAFAKLRPEAMETIAGIRDGSILLEDALIALGVSEGEISEVFDDETFLEFLALAQVGVDALTKEVEDLTLALEGIEITRAQIQVQRVRVLQDLGGATAGEAIPFLESQRDAFRMVAELEESRIIPADELDFTDPEAVDRNLRAISRAEAARNRQIQAEVDIFKAAEQEVQARADAIIEAAEEEAKVYSDLAEEQTKFAREANESARAATEAARGASDAARDATRAAEAAANIADLFIDAAESAASAIDDLLSSISTLPANEARLQREAADIQNQLAGRGLTPEERADAFGRLTDIQQERGRLILQDDPLGGRGRIRGEIIPELQEIEDRARGEELPFRADAEAQAASAAAFAAEAARYEAQAAGFTAQAAGFTAEATALELMATEVLESAADAFERVAEEFGLEGFRARAISNIETIYERIAGILDNLEQIISGALAQAEGDRNLLLTGSREGTPEGPEMPGAGAQSAADMQSGMRGGATGARVGSPGVRDGGEISDPTDSSGLSGLPPGAEQRRSDGLISIGYGSFLGLPPDVADRITRYNAAINDGQSPGPFIEFAQTGFQGIIRQPTTFQVGEGGFPEEVIVRPRRLGSLFEGGTDEDAGEAEGRRGDLNVRISIDLRGATGISASEVADATVEKLLDAVRDDLRYGEARQIIREEVID